MKKIWLALTAVAAAAGTTSAQPARPAWCKPVEGKLMHASLQDALTNSDPRSALPAIVSALCHARSGTEEAQRAREVEAARQRWMKRLAMTDADWPDVAGWASEHQGKLMSTTGLDVDAKKAWSQLTPVEQYVAISRADGDTYLVDALGGRLSEVGRFAFIADCLRTRRGPVEWAVCQGDIDAFDRNAFAAQLRASAGSTAYERMALRLDLFELDDKLAEHAKTVRDAIAKEPAYKTVFATAAAGRAAFAKTDPKLVALADAMDDARVSNSRRAYAGCEDKTWPAMKAAIAAVPAKKLAPVQDQTQRQEHAIGAIANDPHGYLAAIAYVQCSAAGSRSRPFSQWLAESLSRWPGFRGPRTSAVTAIMNAGIELDDRDARLEYPAFANRWISSSGASSRTWGRGKVGKVEKKGTTAVITFAAKLEAFTYCTRHKTTNRIIQIRGDGSLVYDSYCTQYARGVENRASKPQTVDVQYLGGVKPGVFVEVVDDVVLYVWPNGSTTVPSHVAGVEVK